MMVLVIDYMLVEVLEVVGIIDVVVGLDVLVLFSYFVLESCLVFGMCDGQCVFMKVMYFEMCGGFDFVVVMVLVMVVGDVGVGLCVVWFEGVVIVMQVVNGGLVCYFMLQDVVFMCVVMGLLKCLYGCFVLVGWFDFYVQIEVMIDLFEDVLWIFVFLDSICELLMVVLIVFCCNDGLLLNLMMNGLLVDYDCVGMNDLMYDVGVLLVEMMDFEEDMCFVFVVYGGIEVDFVCVCLWFIVDDVLYGFWVWGYGKILVWCVVEWLKYSEWWLMCVWMQLLYFQFELKVCIIRGIV